MITLFFVLSCLNPDKLIGDSNVYGLADTAVGDTADTAEDEGDAAAAVAKLACSKPSVSSPFDARFEMSRWRF